MKTPVDVLNAAFAALNFDDWAGFTALCDPVSLRAFKREIIHGYESDELLNALTVDADDLMETEPDMPREAAEYKAAQMNKIVSVEHRIKKDFVTLSTIDEIRALDPAKLFAHWLKMNSPYRRYEAEVQQGRWADEESWEVESQWEQPDDGTTKETRGYRYSVIGAVMDGDEIAHVLYQSDHGLDKIFPEEYAEWMESIPQDEQELEKLLRHRMHPEFATCRRQPDGTWRLVAQQHFIVISSLRRVVKQEGK
jgi:hypothetical protein